MLRVRILLDFERRNSPLPSGTTLADPLLGQTEIEFDTDEENLHTDVVKKLFEFSDNDCRITHFSVWVMMLEGIWDEPFDLDDLPTHSEERCRELRAILDRLEAEENITFSRE